MASALGDAAGSLSYQELWMAVWASANDLAQAGVVRRDCVGIRIASGTRSLYISILAVLRVGASYVPVDLDDPDERAELVFNEAAVVGVIGNEGFIRARTSLALREVDLPATVVAPRLTDDAWIIFTSGSTGVPKGVAPLCGGICRCGIPHVFAKRTHWAR